jgi:ribonuclease-3
MFDLDRFCSIIDYNFKNLLLLEEALTHPSVRTKRNKQPFHYERFEFLGDAILGFVISDIIFRNNQFADEGVLSRKTAFLTSRDCCYHIGLNLNIGNFLHISKGEEHNGGRTLKKNIANCVESVIAAIYLDSNSIDKVYTFIMKQWGEFLTMEDYLDPKTTLQEWSQERMKIIPHYEVIKTTGPDHSLEFVVEVQIPNIQSAIGAGSSKKIAEKNAAEEMLKTILAQKPVKVSKAVC